MMQYERPEMEVLYFESENVITLTSTEISGGGGSNWENIGNATPNVE